MSDQPRSFVSEDVKREIEERGEARISEDEVLYQKQVIFDGMCPGHAYVARFTDVDGMVNCICARCPMGTRFDPTTQELREGQVVQRSHHAEV